MKKTSRGASAVRLKPSRSSGSADGGWTGIHTSRGFIAGDWRPKSGDSRGASSTAVEWGTPLQEVCHERRPPRGMGEIGIAEKKRASLAGQAWEPLGNGASVSRDGLGSIGISSDPIDRRRVRGKAKFWPRSPGVGDFVYRNQLLSSRQACTDSRRQNWTDERKQNCTDGSPFDCRHVRKQNCTELGRRNCSEMGHVPPGTDMHRSFTGTTAESSYRTWVKNRKPHQLVEETPSWLNVVKPYGGLRINEEGCSSSPLSEELAAGAIEGSGGAGILLLDDQQWPCLRKSISKRADDPVFKSKQQHEETEKREVEVGKYEPDAMLLMLNKDFMVSSPVKQNLLLTLWLTTERKCSKQQQQIFVGHFTAFSSYLQFLLGHDATRVRTESNAGGTSTVSESLSVEYFVRRFQAKDIVTEMEVEYCSLNWKKVDYICTIYGQRVGVSVTRAMSFPNPSDFSTQMAYKLLHKKLFGLVVARHGVSKRHNFSQCILHVWCETPETSCILQQEYEGVSKELDIVNDVIMVLTVAKGWHARSIFYESILKNDVL